MEIVKLLPIVFRLVRMSSELRTATRLSQPTIDELKGALPTLIPVLKRLLNSLLPELQKQLAGGSEGSKYDVRWLQESLNKLGDNIEVDGEYGEETRVAVMRFQKKSNLEVDGWAGTVTCATIAARLDDKADPARSSPPPSRDLGRWRDEISTANRLAPGAGAKATKCDCHYIFLPGPVRKLPCFVVSGRRTPEGDCHDQGSLRNIRGRRSARRHAFDPGSRGVPGDRGAAGCLHGRCNNAVQCGHSEQAAHRQLPSSARVAARNS